MDGGDGLEIEFNCSLYINPNFDEVKNLNETQELPLSTVEAAIRSINPTGPWKVTKTYCGLLASFTNESDALNLLGSPLHELLGVPVQVARFSANDIKLKQSLLLKDVPSAVPLQEIRNVLEQQGIHPLCIERIRQNIKLELADHFHYEMLIRHGMDFLGATRFSAVPDKWRNFSSPRQNFVEQMQQEPIIQCYRCQGFWHIAANCHEMVRCVRCGGPHSVENCQRPRHEPICCHCSGPHHAAYRHCPIRMQLSVPAFAVPNPFVIPH